MANGHSNEVRPQGFPRIYDRITRPQWARFTRPSLPKMPSFSKAEFMGFALAYILKVIHKVFFKFCPSFVASQLRWSPTSPKLLEEAETNLLSHLKNPYVGEFLNIGKCCGQEDSFVRTVSLNRSSNKTPLVILHGFGCGIGTFVMNLDSLSVDRPVYAIDVLGFGRSSRPDFSPDPLDAEMQFFISLEKWRCAVGLEKVILLGHSMGGYIAASYALHYPSSVALLILVDPWGLSEKPISQQHHYDLDSWVNFIVSFVQEFNFLASVRASGPFGPYLVKLFRSDLKKKYGRPLGGAKHIIDYVYHCNVQYPSGEAAFKAMTDKAGWPVNPMMHRLVCLDQRVPITFVYGSRSWINRQPGLQIKFSRLSSFVDVQVIEGTGHHVYADKPKQFNALINEVCNNFESGQI